MTKRATDSTVLKTIGGRGSLLNSAPGLRTLFTATVVALALGGGATSAHAVSGESAETEGSSQAACQDLRTASRLQVGDWVLACDPDGEQCHLSSFSATDEGLAQTYCENVLEVVPYRGGAIEHEVVVDATSFGSITGLTGSTSDIVCQTFQNTATSGKKTTPSPGKKVCVRVFPGTGNCTSPGACGDGSIVVRRDPSSCDDMAAILAGSVTGDTRPNIAWWMIFDVDRLGQAGSSVLMVCPDFTWQFLALSGPIANGVTVEYQAEMYAKTPHYTNAGGYPRCIRYNGEVKPPHAC